jgi:hypothetical protein
MAFEEHLLARRTFMGGLALIAGAAGIAPAALA